MKVLIALLMLTAYLPDEDLYKEWPILDCPYDWPFQDILRCEFFNQQHHHGFPGVHITCPVEGDCVIEFIR